MDIIMADELAKKSLSHIKKDYLHTFLIGVALSAALSVVFYFSNFVTGVEAYLIILFLFILFTARSIYEMLQPFYLVQVSNVEVVAKPYKRLKDSFDYYMSVRINKAYACHKKSCRELRDAKSMPTTFRISSTIFNEAKEQEEMILLLSATKQIIGCYKSQQFFIAN